MRIVATVDTIEKLVEALGGVQRVSELLAVDSYRVQQWVASNVVPRGYHLQLFIEAQGAGYEVDLGLFGLRRPSA